MLINKNNILEFLLALTAFLCLEPFFVWPTYMIGQFTLLPKIFAVTCIFVYLLYLIQGEKVSESNYFFAVSYLLIMIYLSLDYETQTLRTGYIAFSVLVMILIVLNIEKKAKVYEIYSFIFALCIFIGIVPYLFTIFGIPLPFDIILPFEKLKADAGLVYHKTLTTVILYTPPMLRYSAMFNEPGVVGTFSALFLVAENFNLRSNKNRIILLGGILSFATSFYFMVLIWYIVKKISGFNYKNILSIVIIFIVILLLQNVNTPFAPLNRMIQSTRITKVNNEWNFIGNNRQNKTFHEAERNFYSADISQILFGKGRGWASSSPLIAGSYTYKFLIFDHGILGITLILIWLVIYTYYSNRVVHNPNIKYFVLLFLLSIYQRPDVMNIQYLALLIGGIAYNNLQFSRRYTFIKPTA